MSPVPDRVPLDALVHLRFQGCRCDPRVKDAGLLSDGRQHLVVMHAPKCPLLWLAVARWN